MSENDSTHLGTTVAPSSSLMGGVANLMPLSTASPELESDAETTQENYDKAIQDIPSERERIKLPVRIIGISLLAVGIIVGVFLMLSSSKPQTAANSTGTSQHFSATAVPLSPLSSQLNSNAVSSRVLTVNGSEVLSPSSTPSNPTAGQLFYNQTSNQLGYYDGKGFVYLNGAVSSVTNNYTTNNVINQGSVTNVTNIIQGSNLNATGGTPGSIAMFTGTNTLGDSFINQTANSLNVGTGITANVTVGSTSSGSETSIQAGTAGLNINTGAASGTTGTITIQSGDSSSTLAGNVSIDTGSSVINGTIVADKTFEDGTDQEANDVFGDNTTVAQSNAEAHGGTNSLAVTVGGAFFPRWGIADGAPSGQPMIIPVIAGHTYAMEAWVRAGTTSSNITASVNWSNDGYYGGGLISTIPFGTVTDISTAWRKVAGVLTAPAGAQDMGFQFDSSTASSIGEVHYFDDITLTDLSSSSSSSSVNIGATNAQMINIGNSGQLAATSIYGSSVNINGGGGILNMSAATITAASGGATYTTTSGALDITSATAATWKVAGSSGTGSNLTIQAGNGGGPTGSTLNGGNLILQGGNALVNGFGGGVIVQPQADSTDAFAIENAAGTSLLSMDTATTIINDAYTTNAPSGTLEDSATWVNGQYVQLNNGARTDGEVNYTPSEGNSLDATFQFNASGGADSTFFYAYNTAFPNNTVNGVPLSPTNGYIFNYNDFRNSVDLIFNGTVLATSPVSGIGNGSWHTAEVIKNGNVFTMKMDGGTVLTYTDISRTLTGNNFGLGAYSGAFSGTHLVRDFVLTTGSSPGILTTNAFAQFNNSVNISGQAAAGSVLTPLVQTNELDAISGTIALGASNTTDIQLGTGGASPTIPTIQGAAAVGNNLIGANITIDAGNGTGVGGSGNINFYTAGGVSDPLVTEDTTAGTEEGAGSNNATLTWSHTIGAEGNMVLIVSVDTAQPTGATAPATATSVTYNGVALTELDSLAVNGAEDFGSVWYLANPPAGAHTVSVSFTGPTSTIGAESTSFYNVDTGHPIAGFQGQSSFTSSISTTLTGTSAGDGVFDAIMARADWGTSPTPGPGQTELFGQGFFGDKNYGSFRQGVAGATTMSWTGTASAAINQVVMAFNPEPNVVPDTLTQTLSITQSGTLGIDLGSTESAQSTITLGGSANRSIAVNQNQTTGSGHNFTLQAGEGAVGSNNGGNLLLQGGQATGTGTGGSVIVKPLTDSTTAFQIQTAAGSSIFTADTTNSQIIVTGHIVTGGSTPTPVTAGAAANCSSSGSASVTGNDTNGTITVTTGSGTCAAGTLATITFAKAYGANPRVIFSPANNKASTLQYFNGTTGTASFTLDTNTAAAPSTTYTYNYWVTQ